MRAPAPMIAGPRTTERSSLRAGLDHDPALDLGVDVSSPSMRALDVLEHQAVRLEHVVELPGVLPPAADGVALDPLAAVDQRAGSRR